MVLPEETTSPKKPSHTLKQTDRFKIRQPTRNPWSDTCSIGGSSSGAAGATAAGLGHFALAHETAGSIRAPAALCGVYGLKPDVKFGWSGSHSCYCIFLFDLSLLM